MLEFGSLYLKVRKVFQIKFSYCNSKGWYLYIKKKPFKHFIFFYFPLFVFHDNEKYYDNNKKWCPAKIQQWIIYNMNFILYDYFHKNTPCLGRQWTSPDQHCIMGPFIEEYYIVSMYIFFYDKWWCD